MRDPFHNKNQIKQLINLEPKIFRMAFWQRRDTGQSISSQLENVNQNASRTYQVNTFFEVVVVFVHAIIVVWTALPLTFCVIFQNVITHKPRF